MTDILKIGQTVRMADDCPYIGDWQRWTGFVSGIRADNGTGRISYEVSDVWPPSDRSGRTSDCYHLTPVVGSPGQCTCRQVFTQHDAGCPALNF